MKVFYSDHHTFPVPPDHRFPVEKFALLHSSLLDQGVLTANDLIPSPPARHDQIIRAHTADYFNAVIGGTLDERILRQIGLPWSPDLVTRALASLGGTLAAAGTALEEGFSGNLGGGTHHARAAEGMGYCIFNDIAVASLELFASGRAKRIAVVDLDVHQGNGTAEILGNREDVFLLSLHGEKNYPYRRIPSTLDIDLPDGIRDDEYMEALEVGLEAVLAFQPQIVFYQAGVDPLAEDRLGRLSLSMQGLARRDRKVFSECHRRSIPLVLVMGGGYAQPIDLTVQAHVQTYRITREIF